MRIVLDVNVIISGLLAPTGRPAAVLRAWLAGAFELWASPALLEELERALAYPRVAQRITPDEAAGVIDLIRNNGLVVDDPVRAPTIRSGDPGDDYVIALGESVKALIVTGDKGLLALADAIPTLSPAAFLDLLEAA